MDTRVIVIFILLFGSLFAGCIGDEKIAGKYVYWDNPKAYFILYEDGTFNEWFADGTTGSGTYRFQNNSLYMTHVPFGNVNYFVRNGTAFDYNGKEDGRYAYVTE